MRDSRAPLPDTAIWNHQDCHVLCSGRYHLAIVQLLFRHLCNFLPFLWTFTISLTESLQNLARHDASVLKAFNPYYAGHYLVRNKTDGWKSLGGILLAFTGVEALFADLGAFSRRYKSILGQLYLGR